MRTSRSPPAPAKSVPRSWSSRRIRLRTFGSARRSFVLIGPPAWTQIGIRMRRRVLAHSCG